MTHIKKDERQDAKVGRENSGGNVFVPRFLSLSSYLGVLAAAFPYCLSVGAVFLPCGTLSAATIFHTEPRALSKGFQAPYWLVALVT